MSGGGLAAPGRAQAAAPAGERPWMLFLATEFPFPARNGLTAKSANLLQRLARHYQVCLVSFVPPGDEPGEEARALAARHCAEVHLLQPHPRNAAAAVLRLDPPFATRYRTPAALRLLRELVARRRYALAHFDTIGTVPLLPVLQGSGTRTVASINDSYTLMVASRPTPDLWTRAAWGVTARLVGRMERRWYPRFDQVHVVSEVDRRFLMELAPGARVHVVPNGVHAERFHGYEHLEEPRTVVFCGDMSNHGASITGFAATVMPRVWEIIPDARLLVVGRNPPPRLVEMAAAEPRLEVTGPVPDVRPHVARGAVSLSLNPLPGGIQNKILESMAMARAVTGYARNFVSIEGSRDGEHFVAAETPEELTAAVVSLLRDPARRAALGAAGRALVAERYTWEAVEARYLSVTGSAAPAGG